MTHPDARAVADADGRLLWLYGDRRVRSRAERMAFVPGALWSDDAVGANAPGLALSRPLLEEVAHGRLDRRPELLLLRVQLQAGRQTGDAGIGDRVRIEETRPLSKDKHFRLVDIIEKAR